MSPFETAARTRYIEHTNIAEVHAALGDMGGAMAALERAYKDRSQPLLLLWYLREFKPLHGGPRFRALMDKLYSNSVSLQGERSHGAS